MLIPNVISYSSQESPRGKIAMLALVLRAVASMSSRDESVQSRASKTRDDVIIGKSSRKNYKER